MMRTYFVRAVALGALLGALLVVSSGPLTAQEGVELTTTYPAVAVEPGDTISFDLEVAAPSRQRVALSVTRKPSGWETTLRGGGFVITAVIAGPNNPPDVQLEVDVPADARVGSHRVEVRATGTAGSAVLALDLRVTSSAGGSVSLEADFPTLQGASDATFTFDLSLNNDTPSEAAFTLEAAGPEGWQVDARPSGQTQAATVTVPAGGTSGIQVTADPPDDVVAGTYPVGLRAEGGGRAVEATLEVEITGNFALSLTTPDQRLNADVSTGGSTGVEMLLLNDGTAPLAGVTLSATPPSGWEVTFRPETVGVVPPGEQTRVVATITPSDEAVAGDYVVTISASSAEATASVELRTTVKTSGLWGGVGIGIIVLALAGLAVVFRRFGRR